MDEVIEKGYCNTVRDVEEEEEKADEGDGHPKNHHVVYAVYIGVLSRAM